MEKFTTDLPPLKHRDYNPYRQQGLHSDGKKICCRATMEAAPPRFGNA